MNISINYACIRCRLNAWAHWTVVRGSNKHMGPILIYVCYVRHVFQCLNIDFVRSTITINIHVCLILSTIYIFIAVSGCVGSDPSALICPGAYNALHVLYLKYINTCLMIHVSYLNCIIQLRLSLELDINNCQPGMSCYSLGFSTWKQAISG